MYSDYFEILENNKQKAKYQNIIKDIAINGYDFSKKIMLYKSFCIVYCIIWLITLIAIIRNNCVTINFDLILLHELLFWLAFTIFMYFSLCESGYGPNKSNSKERGDSDHYIYFHPNEFKYITLEEDSKHIKKEHKILLDLVIDLSDKENPKTNIVSRNKFYKKLNKRFPLDD